MGNGSRFGQVLVYNVKQHWRNQRKLDLTKKSEKRKTKSTRDFKKLPIKKLLKEYNKVQRPEVRS